MNKEWKIKKLGDVLTVQNGYAFDSKKFVTGEGIPLVRIRDRGYPLRSPIHYILGSRRFLGFTICA